jgi:hypothetical protein
MPFLQCDYYCMTYKLLNPLAYALIGLISYVTLQIVSCSVNSISEVLYICTDFGLIHIIFDDRACLICDFSFSNGVRNRRIFLFFNLHHSGSSTEE